MNSVSHATRPARCFHFISGLPRSGSTLLAALLRQNPRFHADMSSPVAGLVNSLLGDMSERNEFSMFIDDKKRKSILTHVVSGYYEDRTAEVVFDTNRSWCAKMGLINSLFPQAKVIACVRDITWIIDSFERLIQRNSFSPSAIFNYRPDGTIYSRAEILTGNDGMVGYAYNALKEACYGDYTGNLMLLQYETLANHPARAMDAVYSFIGEPAFAHDFEHIQFDASEYDLKAGTPGLHDVRAMVGYTERKTIVPPDLVKRYEDSAFWRAPFLNIRKVHIV
ncbi:sulfotransferase [Burkholderia diffusa]|nr:sulfotransferase [Burkholderia diffusa]